LFSRLTVWGKRLTTWRRRIYDAGRQTRLYARAMTTPHVSFSKILEIAQQGIPETLRREAEVLGWVRDFKREAARETPDVEKLRIDELRRFIAGESRISPSG
jgi:hypothetical protein